MSDLGSGRATNGGSRSTGPIPVPVTVTSTSGIRTPRDVMRDRNAREARRREEQQKAEEQKPLTDERRRSAERRAAGMPGTSIRTGESSSQYATNPPAPTMAADAQGDRRSRAGVVAGSEALGEPVSRSNPEYSSRTRVASQSQPRPVQATNPITRRGQPASATSRVPNSNTPVGTSSQPQPTPASGGATVSTFPHAFERWENLSAHWEGMTSYWLHKLEQNTEEIRDTVPNASTLNRQITDLSAAGANLFHAVVELQRLRASSERKFQRWFFETRAETERSQEVQAQADRQLRVERSAREEAVQKRAEAEEATNTVRMEMADVQRELMISKDEARRAWEELGRQNQESLETAESLKSGRITVVAGVQVVPYFGGPSRTGSASQRPATRDGQQQYYTTGAGDAGREYYRQDLSPTNTDPFTEAAIQQQQQREQASYALDRPSSAATSQKDLQPKPISPGVRTATSPQAQSFYQPATEQAVPSSSGERARATLVVPTSSRARGNVRSDESYGDTMSEGTTEYAIDPTGNIHRDEHGRPIEFRRQGENKPTRSSDDQHMPIVFGSEPLPEAPTVPSTSAQAMATYAPSVSVEAPASAPDYEGSGYGGWEAVQTRHHHPTRLSDVLEEEEERSSRRTLE